MLSMPLPSLVAFGALAPWPAPDRLDQIRRAARHHNSLKYIVKAVQELPLLWETLLKNDASLHSIAGEAAAEQLSKWISSPWTAPIADNKGNVTRMPLTIIAHIVQYINYLNQPNKHISHQSIKNNVATSGGIQGFCIGLLSALAVASGTTEDDVGAFAATSIRLAFCVGAYVDLDQHGNSADSKVSTLAVRWKAPTTLEDIERLLSNYTDTYIAVVRDVKDITITAPVCEVNNLLRDLSQVGASALDTGVSGRYHVAIHEGIPQRILATCPAYFNPIHEGQQLVRSNTDASLLSNERSALIALECILEQRADWYGTMSTSSSVLSDISGKPFILSIGTDAVPQSVSRSLPVVRATMIANPTNNLLDSETPEFISDNPASGMQGYPEDAIAIIGMSCRFPGADSIDEFWNLLARGESMLSEVPTGRFGRDRSARSNNSLRYWGNFLRDVQAFDHGFFKRSPREAESMDPQQRILLQVAYEALESSGYFADDSRPSDIGCYIGACATDYDFNVASHNPTAYSATGTLRSFLSGKLSHYFGWSGPSLVLDTACSSSAVAIHTACTALKSGQCSQALAGGITLMTNPYLYENFAAAHFLSPTGGSKPFSADADGYCRGEGGGLIVLKRISDALRDCDNILGVIAGSAVNQNDNCVPITVPHTTSQGNLYKRVTQQAGLRPSDITFVEAHGTGTPVGDPIEMESIRTVFGGSTRDRPLIVSSAKGNIGHLEGASGVAALIKAVLQMQYRLAPRQALFKTLNPKIPALEPDNICIPTSNLPLLGERLAACVNNYGAAGSNAAIVILEGPDKSSTPIHIYETNKSSQATCFPIQIAAASRRSLLAYCKTLDDYCDQLLSTRGPLDKSQLLPDLAYSLTKRLNKDLAFILTTSATNIIQLQSRLREQTDTLNSIKQRSKAPPVVLCFGGQVSDRVALDKGLWQGSALLRSNLDTCHDILCGMGYPGIYPGIFQAEPVTDVVALHSMIFATQYSCAKAWLESGLKVNAVIGHSFGQLTAMCISGMLSVQDSLKLVAGRASLMNKHWGPESGTMIATEADEPTLKEIQTTMFASNDSCTFEFACFNGPTSQVLVSDKCSVDELERRLRERSIRFKRLNVSYGFHSRFTEPLLSPLQDLASSLTFHEPTIPLETCTAECSWTLPTAKLVAAHTREPVFFGRAIQRLSDRLGPCTWLEAGSDSSIVTMARRAFGKSSIAGHSFLSLQLNKPNSSEIIVDTTLTLWDTGHHEIAPWNFHRLQRPQYSRLRLPPYIWEKSRHWLELDMSATLHKSIVAPPATKTASHLELPPALMHLESVDSHGHHFLINLNSEEFQSVVKDVKYMSIAGCPSTLYVELAFRAVGIASKGKENSLLSLHNLNVSSRLGLDTDHPVRLHLQRLEQDWIFKVVGADASSDRLSSGERCYAEGRVSPNARNNSLREEFSRYERLTSYDNISSIANDPRSESLRGNVMYKMLGQSVNYPNWYRGVISVAALDSRVVAKVILPGGIPEIIRKESTTRLPVLESFLQVANVHANCLHEGLDGTVFQFTGADHLQWAPDTDFHGQVNSGEVSWDVVAYASTSVRAMSYDMFVYDTATSKLTLLLLGVHFKDCQSTFQMGSDTTIPAAGRAVSVITNPNAVSVDQIGPTLTLPTAPPANQNRPRKDAKASIYEDICDLLEKLADIPRDQVPGDASFDDLGVDSLMMIEVISDLATLFSADLPIDELEELTDINSLVNYLHEKGCVGSSFVDGSDTSPGNSSHAQSTGASSPPESEEGSLITTPPSNLTLVDYPNSIDTKPVRVTFPAIQNVQDIAPVDLGPFGIQEVFERLRFDFDRYAEQTGANGFWANVYPQQADLVCSYVIDAYLRLGCNLVGLTPGQQLPSMKVLPRHNHLVAQMHNILLDSGLIESWGSSQAYVRTTKPIQSTPTSIRLEQLLRRHPLLASETNLLNVTGPHLADCLTGKKEPLSLLFGDKHNRELLADFYANSQMCKAATRLLAEFIKSTFLAKRSGGTLRILEVGAGTGGTTKYLLEFLTSCGVSFEYTFTDISQSLVSQAKRNFSAFPQMKFMTLDCDQPAPQELLGKHHIIISTNCIHATSNITKSTANLLPALRDDGALCVVEFTRNLYWFDLVFGLLEGWWLFSDGRQHALANEWFWDSSFRAAGFKHVAWTDGSTDEAKTLRLICAFKGEAKEVSKLAPPRGLITKRAGVPMEELVWKHVGELKLSADIYFPKTPDTPERRRPIALLIHGGGHFLFGRKDVPMKHIRTLLDRGFLPVSIDYRLCPETNLFEGPMTDCCDALQWATETLPTLPLSGPTVKPDPTRVVSFGWSSGGQLAMSLGYTASARGIKSPDAIFALYPPSDMESDHWHKPCYPLAAEEDPTDIVDILAGVKESPIVEYAPVSEKRTMALSLTLKDDRAKIILHMCWNSQTVPVLVHGLPHKMSTAATENVDWKSLPPASVEQVQAISPLWHIRQGNYTTPTFIVHGNADDWLPLSMSERTIEELKGRGIPASLVIPEQCGHAFDLFPVGDPLGVGWAAVEKGYDFICHQLRMN